MAEKKQGGLSGYPGYEYQIVASIWITLSLMLEVRRATEVVVEPESQEDLEVYLTRAMPVPGQESSTVTASDGKSMRVIYQMKTLSGRLWSVSLLRNVISQGSLEQEAGSRSRRRPRALEMLLNDTTLSYTLVTDAHVNPELAGLTRTELPLEHNDAELPEALVEHGHLATLRGRLHILHDLNAELLKRRTHDLLTKKGKVPLSQVDGCMSALTKAFRDCMLGLRDTRFTADELGAMLKQHGARLLPGPWPGYVAPAPAAQAASILREQGCVLVVGPPDIGKASLADYLTAGFELDELPCPLIRLNDLIDLPARLDEEGPALLVVKDGWAEYSEAYPYQPADLSAMLAGAPGDKYVIVTCDLDIYQRLPDYMRSRLQRNIVLLEVEHYDDKARWQIVLNQAGLADWQLESLEASREEVLHNIAEPRPLNQFGALVREHAYQMVQPEPTDDCKGLLFDLPTDDPNSELFRDLVERALQETAGYQAGRLTSAYPNAPLQHAALVLSVHMTFAHHGVLWLKEALPTMERIANQIAHKTGVRLQGAAFIDYLVKMGVVQRWENQRLTFKRESLNALLRLVKDMTHEVHPVLVAVVSDLVKTMDQVNFADHLTRIVTLITAAYPDAPPRDLAWDEVAEAIDAKLLHALDVRNRAQFARNVEASLDWGWGKSVLSRLLYTLHPYRIPFINTHDFWRPSYDAWHSVEKELPEYDLSKLVHRFLIEFMPYTRIDYSAVPERFASFLHASGRVLSNDVHTAVHALEEFVSTDWGDGRWDYDDGNHNKLALLDLLAVSSRDPFVSHLPPWGYKPA